jgi:hypothetical protein
MRLAAKVIAIFKDIDALVVMHGLGNTAPIIRLATHAENMHFLAPHNAFLVGLIKRWSFGGILGHHRHNA